MKIVQHGKKRKAISPVLATVILIAITLIAAIAVAGFVFGLFGSFTSSAQVTASLTGCSIASHTCTVVLTNSGTGNTNLNTAAACASITYAGNTYQATLCSGSLGAAIVNGVPVTATLTFAAFAGPPTAGMQLVGSISLSNSAIIPFIGTFSA